MSRRGGDLFEHVVAFDQLAEGRVLMIQLGRAAVADEELASGGIGIVGAGHGNDAADVGMVVEFGVDLIAGAARSPGSFLGGVFGNGSPPWIMKPLMTRWKQVPS